MNKSCLLGLSLAMSLGLAGLPTVSEGSIRALLPLISGALEEKSPRAMDLTELREVWQALEKNPEGWDEQAAAFLSLLKTLKAQTADSLNKSLRDGLKGRATEANKLRKVPEKESEPEKKEREKLLQEADEVLVATATHFGVEVQRINGATTDWDTEKLKSLKSDWVGQAAKFQKNILKFLEEHTKLSGGTVVNMKSMDVDVDKAKGVLEDYLRVRSDADFLKDSFAPHLGAAPLVEDEITPPDPKRLKKLTDYLETSKSNLTELKDKVGAYSQSVANKFVEKSKKLADHLEEAKKEKDQTARTNGLVAGLAKFQTYSNLFGDVMYLMYRAGVRDDSAQDAKIRSNFAAFHSEFANSSDLVSGLGAGDTFVPVPLFYYPDPMAVVQSIRTGEAGTLVNPESLNAQKAAETAQKSLLTAEQTITQQRFEVERLKNRKRTILADINENKRRLREVGNDLRNLENLTSNTDREIKKLTDEKAEIEKKPEAERDKTRLKAIEDRLEVLNVTKTSLNDNAGRGKKLRTDYEAEKTELETEQDGLDTSLKTAEAQLIEGQKTLLGARLPRNALATTDAEAFGIMAASEPFFQFPAIVSAIDPAKRVQFLVYPRSKRLMLRGPRVDVEMVREWIWMFDRPAPQAKISIQSLQINGADPVRINKAIEESNLAIREAKANVQMVQETLRNAILQEVGRVQKAVDWIGVDRNAPKLQRARFYNAEVLRVLGFGKLAQTTREEKYRIGMANVLLDGMAEELVRIRSAETSYVSYSTRQSNGKKVSVNAAELAAFTFHQAFTRLAYLGLELRRYDETSVFLLAASTLGKPGTTNRSTVFEEFLEFAEHYHRAIQRGDRPDKLSISLDNQTIDIDTLLQRVAAGVASARIHLSQKNSAALTNPETQTNTEYALKILPEPSRATTLGEMIFVLSLASEQSRLRILVDFADQLYTSAVSAKILSSGRKATSGGRRQETDKDGMMRFAAAVASQFGITARSAPGITEAASEAPFPAFPRTLLGVNSRAVENLNSYYLSLADMDRPDTVTSNQQEILYALKARLVENAKGKSLPERTTLLSILEPSSLGSPNDGRQIGSRNRVAAADQMVKRFIESVELDFDHFFYAPMRQRIRDAVARQGVNFGSFTSRSILGSNRLLTRQSVDSSAGIEMGSDRNLLGEAAQLANIFQQAKQPKGDPALAPLAGESLITGLGVAQAARAAKIQDTDTLLKFGAVGALVSALLNSPSEPDARIYSLGNNSVFKVTPIFDPSGQGVRFRFDYVDSILIQEPDGSIDPEFPKIERMTTNTEVQVTNLDLQEIGSFEANYKLGNPRKRSGGIPLLRELLPNVPIIGYFVERGGSKASRQHTLIFAQTVMYPTVGDITDLLTEGSN